MFLKKFISGMKTHKTAEKHVLHATAIIFVGLSSNLCSGSNLVNNLFLKPTNSIKHPGTKLALAAQILGWDKVCSRCTAPHK